MDSSSPYTTLPEVVVNAGHSHESKYRPRVPPKSPRLANALVESMATGPPKPQPLRSQSHSQTLCCVCDSSRKAWKCVQCGSSFCDECWPKERPHWPGKVGIDGRSHEKVDEEVINRLSQIFSQPPSEEQTERHRRDVNTTWFGVIKEANQSYLHYSNRLVDILRDSQMGQHSERFPQLVSFVGQTGMLPLPFSPLTLSIWVANEVDT
ncbi:hypothetical protein FDECE_9823 [Fusarium decemcellulare]|nr:hypothetical protein FDECE_9823 [Fusarium decemcellulare]